LDAALLCSLMKTPFRAEVFPNGPAQARDAGGRTKQLDDAENLEHLSRTNAPR